MRKHKKVFCNKCGKKFIMHKDIVHEGIFNMEYMWGYFSKKDGEIHSFDLCEECYDKMISQFKIPVDIRDSNEMI